MQYRGDDTPDALYAAVGVALTTWERLDDSIGHLFGILVNSRMGAAEAAFGMVQSIDQQMRMVIAAAERIYPKRDDPFRVEIVELITKELTQMAGVRNDIAHGYVSVFHVSATDQHGVTTETDWGHFLIPGHTNTKKRLSNDEIAVRHSEFGIDTPPHYTLRYAYTAEQILTYAGHFHDYLKRVRDLIHRVFDDLRQKMPQPELRELILGQQIRELQTKLTALESELRRLSSDSKSETEDNPPKS